MTGTITTATLDVRGATLYYEVRGQGPLVERRRPDGRRLVRPVSYAVAGAMLGIACQGVHDLVTRGKLGRHESGGVTTALVQRRITSSDARETLPRALREEVSSESGE
ncbi:hypothetical protein ACU635_31565 [[Actinomadura] parvosata]|uniref:hypothetical protein n=1 Tax=[Actinomadura] parvosata TaxID=1955412 RepID=UPI00406C60F2